MNYLFLGLVGIFILRIIKSHAVVDKYEYLLLLNHYSWKPGRKIRDEMRQRKKGWLGYIEVYDALSELEDEGLVERRTVEFRLTSTGLRKKLDQQEYSSISSPLTYPAS